MDGITRVKFISMALNCGYDCGIYYKPLYCGEMWENVADAVGIAIVMPL